MTKKRKQILIGTSVFLVIFFAAGLFVGNFFYNLAINPYGDKSTVTESEVNQISFDLTALSAGDDWLSSIGYTYPSIATYDGLQLQGYAIENPDATGWVMLSHGYGGHARQLGYYAQNFYNMGLSVLLVDARGHGNSEGHYMGMGVHDRFDVLEWVDWLNESYNTSDIALFGVSMGGATVMMASGETLPANVHVIVEDCGYTSARDEFSYQLKALFNLPSFPVIHFSSLVTKARAGFWFGEVSALDQVAKSTTPTLFIHGELDTFVPASMVEELYNACGAEKEILIIEGAGHGGAATEDSATYWQAVATFMAGYMDIVVTV